MLLRDINKNINSVKLEPKSFLMKWKQSDAKMKNLKTRIQDWSFDLALMNLLSKTQKCRKLKELSRIDTNRWSKMQQEECQWLSIWASKTNLSNLMKWMRFLKKRMKKILLHYWHRSKKRKRNCIDRVLWLWQISLSDCLKSL